MRYGFGSLIPVPGFLGAASADQVFGFTSINGWDRFGPWRDSKAVWVLSRLSRTGSVWTPKACHEPSQGHRLGGDRPVHEIRGT